MKEKPSLTQRVGQVCKNVTVSGRRTSLRMETIMWESLNEICSREGRTVHDVCSMVDNRRGEAGLTASIRVFIITYFRQAALSEHRFAGFAEPAAAPPSAPRTPSPLVRAALDACGPVRA